MTPELSIRALFFVPLQATSLRLIEDASSSTTRSCTSFEVRQVNYCCRYQVRITSVFASRCYLFAAPYRAATLKFNACLSRSVLLSALPQTSAHSTSPSGQNRGLQTSLQVLRRSHHLTKGRAVWSGLCGGLHRAVFFLTRKEAATCRESEPTCSHLISPLLPVYDDKQARWAPHSF